MIYLACPYSHPEPEIRHKRFMQANMRAAYLMAAGHHVFSPISHTHPIAEVGNLPRGWDFWAEYDEKMLSICDKLIVITLDGWKTSVGVQAEIEIATRLGLEISYIN